ncbi:hypothetical protein [Kerstersia similis]|uniref:hypothetical protein n=1 Tax=Kerstersia similis TaxID=206505 RepID=UPI0039EEB686
MSKRMSDRQMKIALLRTQASVERELLLQYAASARDGVSRVTGLGSRIGGSGIVGSALRIWMLALRHPVITSTASAWLLRGKRARWLRLGGVALLAWRVFNSLGGRR